MGSYIGRRDAMIATSLVALGLIVGAVVGWHFGWRVGAGQMRDSLLCLTATLSDDHFDDAAIKYCGRIGTPIAESAVHNAQPHKGER